MLLFCLIGTWVRGQPAFGLQHIETASATLVFITGDDLNTPAASGSGGADDLDANGSATLTTPALGSATTYGTTAVGLNGYSNLANVSTTVAVNTLPTATITGSTTICKGASADLTFSGTPGATVTYTVNGGSNQTIQLNDSGAATLATGALYETKTYALVSASLNGYSQNLSGSATVTLNAAGAYFSGSGTAICAGQSANLSISGTSNAVITYKIVYPQNPVVQGTVTLNASGQGTLTTGPLTVTTSYALTQADFNGCSTTIQSLTNVNVNPPPTASIGGGGTTCAGGSVTVSFSGTPNATVSYTVNGGSAQKVTLDGSGSASVQATVSGTYALTQVSLNGCTQPVSGSANVILNPLPTASITGGGMACVGNPVPVYFSGTPNATVTYTVNGGGNQTIQLNDSGAASLQATASGNYALVSVSNGTCSQAQSGNVSVTVSPVPTASISGTTSVCSGTAASIGFTGTPNATVTYTVNGGSNQTIQLDGTGAATVSTGNLSANATYALVSAGLNGCSQTLSGSATVTVTPLPTVTANASPNPVCETATLTLTAPASGGTGTLTYAWSGPNGFQASSGTATRTVGLADGGVYQVTVTDQNLCKATTQTTSVTVYERARVQGITPSQSVCPGTDFTLTVQATGSNLTYQWYRVVNNQTQAVAGATSASLTITPATPASYYVVVTGPCNQVTSPTTALTLKQPSTLQVSSQVSSVCEGGNLTLTVRGTGPGTLTYSWRKDDPNGPVIASGANFTVQNAQPTDAGTYYATVQGDCPGPTVSIPVTVRYARITQQPQSQALCSGTATLTVGVQTVGVGLTPTYQWKRNGTNIAGATSASYTTNRTGSYTVEVRTACGTLTSDAATLSCSNGRLALEETPPALTIAPNPTKGSEIRCRVTGLAHPSFSLLTGTGHPVNVQATPTDEAGQYRLRTAQPLPTGLYVLEAHDGDLRLAQRLLVVE
jgi:hypothetical protein